MGKSMRKGRHDLMFRRYSSLCWCAAAFLFPVCAETQTATLYSQNPGTPWPAIDGVGRLLPDSTEAGSPRPNRFVGIFYFSVARAARPRTARAICCRRHPPPVSERAENAGIASLGSERSPHFWGEPLFGFY